jgi:monoamine oxidase
VSAPTDVEVVRGGAAGVAAARRLAAAGLTTVVFEADSRLGGRAWTRQIAGLHLDLGCGWMHSAEKNAWVALANEARIPIDRSRAAWGIQYRGLGFAPGEQAEARAAFESWVHRLAHLGSDRAADALEPDGKWNAYIRAIVNFICGGSVDELSVQDYLAYDEASTDSNWRAPSGYGALVAASFPDRAALHLATPVQAVELAGTGVTVRTPTDLVRAPAVVLTV